MISCDPYIFTRCAYEDLTKEMSMLLICKLFMAMSQARSVYKQASHVMYYMVQHLT